MEKSSFDVIVMGGGPGGIEAAITAAREGLSVVIVKNQKPGGRAVWGSLVPSKVWLKAAEAASVMRHGAFYALGAQECRFDITNLEARIVAQSESASGRYRQGLKEAGVTAVAGKGVILAPGTVQVKRETGESAVLNGRFIIVATGSEPVFLPNARPAPPRIFAPRHAASLPELPGKLLVVGGGVTGVEYSFVFAALGTPVAILHSGTQLMPRLDSCIAATLEDYLKKRLNIQIYKHDAVRAMRLQEKSVEAETAAGLRYQADYALLATGRAADLTFYDPAAISFALTPEKALAADEFGQTSQPGIYAVGDVTGAPMFANRATMQARVAVMHLLKGDSTGLHPKPLIEMAYTYPPVGQIGNMEQDTESFFVEKHYSSLLKAHLEGETSGLLRIKINDQTGLISGAAVFGQQAAELLGMIQLAMHQAIPYHKLRSLPLAHPSYGELLTA